MGTTDARGIGEVSAECSWPVLPERVIAIVRDQDGIDGVLSTVSESTLLPEGRVVQVHTLGWGIADRQVTLRFRGWPLPDGGHLIEFRQTRAQQRLGVGGVARSLTEVRRAAELTGRRAPAAPVAAGPR